MKRSSTMTAVVLGIFFLSLAPSFAGEHPGKALYRQYCASCHGLDAKGRGDVSGLLHATTPDLTQLSRQAGGEFPYVQVVQIIDGRSTVRAHGDPDMPVWGEVFGAEPAQPASMGKVVLITEYLQLIQEKPPDRQ